MQLANREELYKILLIVKSLGVNFPVLKELNLEIAKLPMVIVKEGELKIAATLLSRPDTPRLNELMNLREIKENLTNVNSDLIVFPYVQTSKGVDFINMLAGIVKMGAVSDVKINALPVVIAEAIPPESALDDLFMVVVEESLKNLSIDDLSVVPEDEQLPVVCDKIRTQLSDELSGDEQSLIAATCFLYPNMVAYDKEEDFSEMLEIAKKLAKINDDNGDTNNIGAIFVADFYRWQEKTEFYHVYQLPNLEMKVVEMLEAVVLYDEKYVYCKESLFRKIAEPLLKIFSEPVLKRVLVNDGILCPEKAKTFTVKMGYYNCGGVYQRERMLRFECKKLEVLGEMDLIEQCIERKEKRSC